MKKLLKKIKKLLGIKTKKKYTTSKQFEEYLRSIERDDKGRWIFPEQKKTTKLAQVPVELIGNKDWQDFKKVAGDPETWKAPCLCDVKLGKCRCKSKD